VPLDVSVHSALRLELGRVLLPHIRASTDGEGPTSPNLDDPADSLVEQEETEGDFDVFSPSTSLRLPSTNPRARDRYASCSHRDSPVELRFGSSQLRC
jgi:hypothetical protein